MCTALGNEDPLKVNTHHLLCASGCPCYDMLQHRLHTAYVQVGGQQQSMVAHRIDNYNHSPSFKCSAFVK